MASRQKLKLSQEKGFTIIEVVLFLAISGLFFVIAFSTIGTRTRNTQFTLAMEQTQELISDVVTDLNSGVVNSLDRNLECRETTSSLVISSGSSDIAGEDCVLLGKVIDFMSIGSEQVRIYDVLGSREALKDDSILLSSSSIKHLSLNETALTEELPGGLEYRGVSRPKYAIGLRMLGFFFRVDNPSASNVIPVGFTSSGTAAIENPSNYDPASRTVGDNFSARLCFQSDDRQAEIVFGWHNRQLSGEIDYDTDCVSTAS